MLSPDQITTTTTTLNNPPYLHTPSLSLSLSETTSSIGLRLDEVSVKVPPIRRVYFSSNVETSPEKNKKKKNNCGAHVCDPVR